jgi:mono/diheme cytochrome c family protein
MATATPTTRRISKILFGAALLLMGISLILATRENRQWKIPDEAKQRKNPLQPSAAALQAVRGIYLENCAQCHGDTGKGDGPEAKMHDPLPADLSNYKFNFGLSDGEIFYQISQGKKPMPAFKGRLTEDQRWQLVFLVRDFAQARSNEVMR